MTVNGTKRYPCPDCGSSDGVMIDPSDGHTYCFACKTRKKEYMLDAPIADTGSTGPVLVSDIHNYPSFELSSRSISKEVVDFFGVKTHQYNDKPAHFYPYGDDCYKVRILPKDFRVLGKPSKLFGNESLIAAVRC